MKQMSDNMNALKKLSKQLDPLLYAGVQAAWMGLCLLNDARLEPVLEKTSRPDVFRREKTIALLQALDRMESACSGNRDIIKITNRIRRFVKEHPAMSGGV